MGIFNNNKTIVAVFDSDQALEQVTQQLSSRGLIPEDDDHFVVLDHAADDTVDAEDRLMAVPAAVPATGASGSGIAGLPVILNPHPIDDDLVDNLEGTRGWLTNRGLDDDAASYYAMQVKRGGKVLILEVDKDHVSEIINLIEPVSERVTVA